MTKATRILIFHVPAGGGHKAAARAIAEAASARGIGCEVVDALELTPPWFAKAYVGAHLRSTEHTPAFYGHGFAALNQRNPVVDGVRGAFDRAIGAGLLRYVKEARPTAIISTHFFPLAVLGPARLEAARPNPWARGRASGLATPLVGVVTDYAAHAFWAEPGVDRFCTPRGQAARDLVRHGASADRIVATGIPIRPAFGRIPAMTPPRPGEPLRVLVTSGGFGVGPMIEVVRSFAGVPNAALTIVCGANEDRVAEARRAVASAGVTAEIVGFEPDMARRMAEAHVLVGKPGGLTVSEALAAGRPMVLVGACPGQETMNQDFLVDHGAGVVAEAASAGRVIAALRDRGELATIAAAARSLAAPAAADRVLDVALRLVDGAAFRPIPAAA